MDAAEFPFGFRVGAVLFFIRYIVLKLRYAHYILWVFLIFTKNLS